MRKQQPSGQSKLTVEKNCPLLKKKTTKLKKVPNTEQDTGPCKGRATSF